ncbi:hypothetical protein RJ639_038270 [Escallonia herrerae]|uniref:Uncharacterized protein n=1 Tax=Escallonia herrerae TaxID=1293975 RepID=A0AA89BFA6_9ASTE|nr:hypothetical protein RJ639_038270 [Escallonia herrerae]
MADKEGAEEASESRRRPNLSSIGFSQFPPVINNHEAVLFAGDSGRRRWGTHQTVANHGVRHLLGLFVHLGYRQRSTGSELEGEDLNRREHVYSVVMEAASAWALTDLTQTSSAPSPSPIGMVTNFKCGGYAIGIGCSLLLTDPVSMANILKRWANIHNRLMVSITEIPKTPTFYLPNIGKNGCSSPYPGGSVTNKNSGQSVIFKFASKGLSLDSEMQETLAALCIEAADRSFATKMASKFSLMIKGSFKDAFTVENYAKRELVTHDSSIVSGLTCVSWEDLGGDEICLNEGNKPASVSYWIISGCGEGLVMVIPSPNDGLEEVNILLAVPNCNVT